MTIAQAFNLAFQEWKDAKDKTNNEDTLDNKLENANLEGKTSATKDSESSKKTSPTEDLTDEQNPLIDLNSPGDDLNVTASTDVTLVEIDIDDTNDMNDKFSK